MARVGRLAGAILAETERTFYLVGSTKVPCDFAAAGFERPVEIDRSGPPFVRLVPCRPVEMPAPLLQLDIEGEALARLLVSLFVIERTGSISERLWRLVIGETDDGADPGARVLSARWMGEIPEPIWRIVRDSVLRCT